MDNLEIVFQNIPIGQIERLLDLFRVTADKITNVHFYQDGEDVEDYNLIDFDKCYLTPSTGFIRIDTAYAGIAIQNVMIIIAGVKPTVEVTINFKELEDEAKIDIISEWIGSLDFPGYKISFGYEDEEPLVEISNLH